MHTVTIKVGQSVDFKVPVIGEPSPVCVWTFKDKPIDKSDTKIRVIIINFLKTILIFFRLSMKNTKQVLRYAMPHESTLESIH